MYIDYELSLKKIRLRSLVAKIVVNKNNNNNESLNINGGRLDR